MILMPSGDGTMFVSSRVWRETVWRMWRKSFWESRPTVHQWVKHTNISLNCFRQSATLFNSFFSQPVTVTWKELSVHHVTLKLASAFVVLESLVSSVMSAPQVTPCFQSARSATHALPCGLKMSQMCGKQLRGWGLSSLAMATTSTPGTLATGKWCWTCTPS